MGIRILTDSTSDISKEEEKRLDITVVPLKVIFGDQEYKEGIEITIDGFYEKLVQAATLPTTSQPAPDDFLYHFNLAKEAGDSVIVILISEKLSGTAQSAVIAKDMADYDNIYIIDSTTSTMAMRLLVQHAVKMKNEGRSVHEIVETINRLKDRIILFAMVDTLEYLHKGGRLSKSSAIIGSLLKFKPIIKLEDGVVGVAGKERGTNKGIVKILETIEEYGTIDFDYPVNLGYTAEKSTCNLLKEKLEEKYDLKNPEMYPVGCVVGTHVGPGACFIAFIRK